MPKAPADGKAKQLKRGVRFCCLFPPAPVLLAHPPSPSPRLLSLFQVNFSAPAALELVASLEQSDAIHKMRVLHLRASR